VSRWRTWAEELRNRHGRRERTRAFRSVVFVRHPRPMSQVLVANQRTSLHVHARLQASWRVAPTLTLRPHARQTLSVSPPQALPPRSLSMTSSFGTGGVRTRPSRPLFAAPHQAFVAARRGAAASMQTDPPPRRPRALQRSDALTLQRPSRKGARVAIVDSLTALPVRLRRQGARHELPVQTSTVALARTSPRVAPAVSTQPAVARGQSSVPSSWTPPASPAMTVETLTSHVMQQLDRRLVAYRERMGRV
jgi:hypothetical protein